MGGLAVFGIVVSVFWGLFMVVIFIATWVNTRRIRYGKRLLSFIEMGQTLSQFHVEFATTKKLSKTSLHTLELLKNEVESYKVIFDSKPGADQILNQFLSDINDLVAEAKKAQ